MVNGNLTDELFYRGSANVYCDLGYEGGGAAECGSNGAWVTVPTCEPIGKYIEKRHERCRIFQYQRFYFYFQNWNTPVDFSCAWDFV